jgi:hypothetical protein
LVLDLLYGPIYMRFLIGHDTLTPEFVDRLCALVLDGAVRRPSHGNASGGKSSGEK